MNYWVTIFGHEFLYTAYADDTAFYLKDQKSAFEVFKTFDTFLLFLWSILNKSKSEIAGKGALKG